MGIAIAAAALAVGGAVAAGYGASQATKDANAQARKLSDQARDWNYQRFLESRGQGGQALLPLYFPQYTEGQLAQDALASYNAQRGLAGSPEQELAAYQSAVQGMMPSMAASDQLVADLLSGKLNEQQVANIQPVLAARSGVAGAQKTGILEGLKARLNALSADRARAGYTGGGSAFQRNLLMGATIPAQQAAATVGAQADLANATDVANLKNAGIQQQLQGLNLPVSQAQNRLNLMTAPQAAQTAAQSGRMNLFNWFKMNPQAYQWNNVPNQMVTPNSMMIAGSGMQAAGNALGSYGLVNLGAGGGGGSGWNTSTYNAGDEALINYYNLRP